MGRFRRDDGRQLVIAWTKRTDQTVNISVDRAARSAVEHHVDATSGPYAPLRGRTLLRVELRRGTTRVFELVP
jgi:hypothetical protein